MSAWEQDDAGRWKFGTAIAKNEDGDFCILEFNSTDLEFCFSAIQAAMQFGMITIAQTPENRNILSGLEERGAIGTKENDSVDMVIRINESAFK